MKDTNSHNSSNISNKKKERIKSYLNKRSLLFKKFKKADTNKNADKELFFSLNKSKLPNIKQLKYVGQFLNKKERKIINICLVIIFISLGFLGIRFHVRYIKPMPAKGGSYTENLIGSPQFINPLYASINNVDSDIAKLVYSGLLKKDKDNQLTPDLAEKFEISEDEKVYTFYLRQNVEWHDKEKFSADDIMFTFDAINNREYKSPLKISFDGVNIERVDDYTIRLILIEPYAAFLELLTIGILPSHIWQQIPPASANLADVNVKPIGSGPYKFKSLSKDKSGNIRSYELELNKKYYFDNAYIENIIFKFAPNFMESINSLNEGRSEGIDFLPTELTEKVVGKNNYNFNYLQQPQYTAIFFNQSNLGDLSDKRIKQALAYAINKNEIIDSKPHEFAQTIEGPMLPMFTDYYKDDIKKYEHNLEQAQTLLNNAGWPVVEVKAPEPVENEEGEEVEAEEPAIEPGFWRKKGSKFLIINLTSVDQADNIQTAELIKTAWENLNIKVNLNIVSPDLIQSETIRPRNYQILLYGVILGDDPDQYPFWHSSQIGSNGLNLANYNNKSADELLEDGRITNNLEIRQEKYNKFQDIIANDLPAIFLYSQKYLYLNSNKIKGFDMQSVIIPSDRFNNITNWYIKTRKKIVW